MPAAPICTLKFRCVHTLPGKSMQSDEYCTINSKAAALHGTDLGERLQHMPCSPHVMCHLLQVKSKAVMEHLQPLDAEETQIVCAHWLSQTAEGAQAAILQLLRGCRDAAALAAAESKLRAAIHDWKHAPQLERTIPQGEESSWL